MVKTEPKKKSQRTLQGVVVKKSGARTIRVRVERKMSHPLYKKVVTKHKSYLVHCVDTETVKEGDLVSIAQIRPISKNKHWALVKVINKL
jgi:small subunit ribosomal protein S17